MEILQVLMDPILPVFAIMAFGFGMGRTGKASISDARVINRFAMSVLLPIMIFGVVAKAPIHTFSIIPVAVYVAMQATVFTIGFVLALKVFRREAGEAVLLGFCGIFANNVFYVLPISVLLYGEGNVLPVTTVITLDSTLTFGGAMIALQLIKMGRASPALVAISIARTPLLQAMAAGLVFSIAGLTIPTPIQTFLDFNGVAAAPVALYALGVVMSQTALRPDRVVTAFAILKMFVFPALIWLGLERFAPDDPGRGLYLLAAAGPAGAMAFSMAFLHDIRTDAIAQIIIWTSVLTLLSLAILA